MVKVKFVKLPDRMKQYLNEDEIAKEEQKIGTIYEAFEIHSTYQEEDYYKHQYALNMGDGVWFVPMDSCEVVETFGECNEVSNTQSKEVPVKPTNRILLVEDGSVDIDHIEDDLGIDCIVYRSGANKPEWL